MVKIYHHLSITSLPKLRKRQSAILLAMLVTCFAFIPVSVLQPGLNTPTPVGPFLNGNFPTSVETGLELQSPFSQASFSAILATAAEPASTRVHFAQRGGQFYWVSSGGDGSDKTLFMDISGRVWTGQDSGVLGMAFHPDYNKAGNPNRNFVFVYYVTSYGGDEYIRLSRFTRIESNNTLDPNSESILFDQVLGPTLHRGGGLQFGNDGFLYLAIGDLGWTTQSQNITDRLSGAVLRIDVDKRGGSISHPVRRTLQSVGQGTTGDYYIPNDNPFLATNGSVFEEYYTLGCRNPHRMTIDRVTGDLYIGNVGSNSGTIYEEINLVSKGANFGWPYREGFNDRPDLMARPSTIIGTEVDPIHAYDHSGGNSWVLGGYVYRGSALPDLYGKYIFADGGSRKIWALDISGNAPYTQKEEIANSTSTFYSFAEDQSGELYLTSNSVQKLAPIGGTQSGIADGTYYVRVRHSDKYLSVSGASQSNGATFVQWDYAAGSNQQFTVENIGGGVYTLTAIHSGKVLDVEAFGTTDGSDIHQWTWNNTANQKWYIEPAGGTYFRIRGLQSSLDVEVANSSTANGANVQLGNRETSNNFNQLWEFIPVSGGNPVGPSLGIPQLLSQTGAFSNLSTLTPASGIVPYDMITELWSDGAEKYRWLSVPNDGTHNSSAENIVWSEEGEWGFPVGSVFIKHFEIQTDKRNANSIRRLETRFLIHGENGFYAVTYRWRPDGSDAELLESSFEDNLTITETDGSNRQQTWYYPSRSECFICHTEASGRVLGPKTRHLNRDILYPSSGQTGNQIETYNHLGMFDQDLNVSQISSYLSAQAIENTSASVEDRARSYLDINCSSCHRPGGGTRGAWNALLSANLSSASIINGEVVEDLGISGAKIIVPGDTAKSVLYQRLKQVDTGTAMPPLAKAVQHQEGVALIAEWINTMDPNAGGGENGLMATYYDNMDFTNEAMRRIDPEINFDWVFGSPTPLMDVNTFSIRWEGFVEAPTTGTYTFYTTSDDGVRLWVNDQLIVENWTVHPATENSGTINLVAGQRVPIRMDFFENGGHAVAKLSWSANGVSKQTIPQSALFTDSPEEQIGSGLLATYFDNMDFTNEALQRIDPTIDFNWGNGSPDGSIGANTFSVRWEGEIKAPTSGTYTFYTNSDDGVRLWINNQFVLENWTDHAPTENSGTISMTAGQKVAIRMEFYENGGGAVAQLRWSANGVAKQIVPTEFLFPTELAPPEEPDPASCTATGEILAERWDDVVRDVRDLTALPEESTPDASEMLTEFVIPDYAITKYGVRTRGYLCAPLSGNYIFTLRSDNTADLWISTDGNPNHRDVIAYVSFGGPGLTNRSLVTRNSSPIYLEKGKTYYIEARVRDRGGDQATSIGWTLPSGASQTAIPGDYLSPVDLTDTELPGIPQNVTAELISFNGIKVNWEAPADTIGVAGYYVYPSGNTSQALAYITNGDTHAILNDLPTGADYQFSVATVDVAGNLSPFASSNSLTLDNSCEEKTLYMADMEEGTGIWQTTGTRSYINTDPRSASSGTQSILLSGDLTDAQITTVNLDLEAYDEVLLGFSFKVFEYWRADDSFFLKVSTDGGETFNTVREWRKDFDFDDLERSYEKSLNRPTRMSSQYGNGSGDLAVDGNLEGSSPWSADLVHTNNEAQPWWEVDLGARSQVDSLVIYNRTDGSRARLKNFYVLVSESPMNGSLAEVLVAEGVSSVYYAYKADSIVRIPLNAEGRYVRVQLSGSDVLHFAEAQVIGCNLEQVCETPVVSIDPAGPFNEGGSAVQLVASPAGGVWSGDVNGSGVFDPSQGIGSYEVIYTYEEFAGCVGADTLVIDVLPAGSICEAPLNLALGKTASQSSTYGNGLAGLAVDGNTSGSNAWSADLQHTNNEAQPWWQVDLGLQSRLNELVLYNRSDNTLNRLKDFYILVSDVPMSNGSSLSELLASSSISQVYFPGAAGFVENISLDGITGRYVRIQLTGNNVLHMSEVEIMGCAEDGSCIDPIVSIGSAGPFTADAGVQQLVGSPAGGSWSGAVSATGVFDPTQGIGSYEVIYSYTDAAGCGASAISFVEVIPGGCEVTTNLALGKVAEQSSTYGNGQASVAIDGNTNGTSPWSADLAHTNNEAQPWWQVDLGAVSNIQQVKLFNRTDCCQGRLRDFHLLTSNQAFSPTASLAELLTDPNVQDSYIAGAAGVENVYNIVREARYVRIQLSGSNILHLAEVQVLGCASENDPCFGVEQANIFGVEDQTIGFGSYQLSANPVGGTWSGDVTADGLLLGTSLPRQL